ncbi:Rhodanese/Cell cycle control phosphatase superfamily protein isoform 3 [Theobroma cacao]|uniref:Rhodanese/Cell cycle control phosphatase superfamily protein isoform 3 n=1 Tax=Theobroma cacao TaxID=3641 RepID=A0A061FSX5_THECC|nr:Rhodanese/Cell cycle control phosphatase superfamily protein isoform 3 [Theobroma cacao]
MLRCRPPLSLALRMLSSSSHTSNPNPIFHLPCTSRPTSGLPLKARLSNSCSSDRRMTLSKCFTGAAADPIPVSSSGKPHCCQNPEEPDSDSLVVVSFYRFADFPDHADLRKPLKKLCEDLRVSGGIILAPEGINGSICGTRESVERVLGFIQTDDRLKGLRQIESPVSPEQEAIHHGHSTSSPLAAGEDAPFRWDHVRVKLKKEIVTLGMPEVSPIEKVGKYVSPKDWNALISDPDTVVIDVRNNYETRIGMFKGAVDPVYHLKGGILKYLEEVPKTESLWEGECFVFDKRVSVEHGLVQGNFKLCYGCKQPVSDADMEAPEWEYGVSCPHCFLSKSEEEKERARARQRQFETWGIIGGLDKGRRPASKPDSIKRNQTKLSSSV